MTSELFPATAALLFGTLLAMVLFIPFAAYEYRRRGSLRPGSVVLGFGIVIYALSLATYTLLPLPSTQSLDCRADAASAQLNPAQAITDVITNGVSSPAALLANPALQQLLLNVALFTPLGILVRGIFSRSLLVTVLVGFAISLFIETTQLTGDWFVYPCAYRLFDVDDLLTNTAGAALGGLLAPVLHITSRHATDDPDSPRPVGVGRRLLGMLSDWGGSFLIGSLAALIFSIVELAARIELPNPVDSAFQQFAPALLPAGIQLWSIVRHGQTLGERVVRLAPVGEPSTLARIARWSVGIGGYLLLGLVTWPPVVAAVQLVALSVLISVFFTRDHRGLGYAVLGWELKDERA